MSEKYTFLFAPVEGQGHFNACFGIAGQLRDRGHKVVFATPDGFRGKLEPLGYIEEYYSSTAEQTLDVAGDLIKQMGEALALPPEEQTELVQLNFYKVCVKLTKFSDAQLRKMMDKVKPDVVILDTIYHTPALTDAGVPWVFSVSMNPIAISTKNVPPAFSGFPTDDRSKWETFENKRTALFKETFLDFQEWVANNGGPKLEYNQPFFIKYSPFANIYMYPIELDYTAFRPNPPKWHRFDAFVRTTEETFEIPEKLRTLPGKLIYFSMGTIGCSELGLMKRLIGILCKSPHRFIVSQGPFADKYSLPENMWGDKFVPQTKVIPMVDLVITHGGNNTITESFYFGKRVLVLPLFCDQLDNAQRVFETGLGLRFHPYHVTENELLPAIDSLLKDELLERRMNSIGQRIRSSNSQVCAADLVENVARNNHVKSKDST